MNQLEDDSNEGKPATKRFFSSDGQEIQPGWIGFNDSEEARAILKGAAEEWAEAQKVKQEEDRREAARRYRRERLKGFLEEANFTIGWLSLTKLSQNRIVQSSFIYLFIVPFLVQIVPPIKDALCPNDSCGALGNVLTVPFRLRLSYVAAFCFASAVLLTSLGAPIEYGSDVQRNYKRDSYQLYSDRRESSNVERTFIRLLIGALYFAGFILIGAMFLENAFKVFTSF